MNGPDTLRTDPTRAERRIRVGVAEYAVSTTGTALSTCGLGSCIGIALYDPTTEIGGLGHVMLPAAPGPVVDVARFADTCVPALLGGLRRVGAEADAIRAKLAGGSSTVSFSTDAGTIGAQNATAVRAALAERDVPVVAEDVGGEYGRSLTFRPRTGALEVNCTDGETRVI